MHKIAVLPTPLARAALAGSNPRNAATCGIYDIAGRLGQAHRRPRWLCHYLARLVAEAGFPAAFPLLRGGALAAGIHADSRWSRATVDAWFDGQLPPAARAAGALAERVEVDSRLSVNLATLFGDAA